MRNRFHNWTTPHGALRPGVATAALQFAVAGILLAGAALGLSAPSARAETAPIAFVGASLFDSQQGVLVPDQTILIQGELIEDVGPQTRVRVPDGAQVIDGRGKYIIPGLIDAHIHLAHQLNLAYMTGDEVLPMFLAAGVTSLRNVGDSITAEKLVARYADAHPEFCPRIFLGSPLIDGPDPYHKDIGWAIKDPEEVPAFTDDMKAWGVTTLKIYVGTERAVGQRVIQEGHKRGMMVTGHLGHYSAQDAAADGIDCLEHIWSVFDYIIPDGPRPDGYRAVMDLTTPKAKSLVDLLVEKKVRVDPTLVIFKNALLLVDQEAVYNHPDMAHAPARLQRRWESHRKNFEIKPDTLERRKGEFQKYQELTGILHRAGVTILAGTDAPEPFVPPGFALLQELELLVESGLSPAAALQSATINNAAAIMQESRLGSIDPGKLADLVVLSADPLADIRNVRKIEKVVRGGLISEPEQLLKRVPAE